MKNQRVEKGTVPFSTFFATRLRGHRPNFAARISNWNDYGRQNQKIVQVQQEVL